MANIIKQLKDSNGNNIYPIAYAQGGMKMDLLWTNPSPTASFGLQTIYGLNPADYDIIVTNFYQYVSGDTDLLTYSFVIPAEGNLNNVVSMWYSNTLYRRMYSVGSDYVYFANAMYSTAVNTNTTDNTKLIPYKIYGIKMSYIVPTVVNGLQYVEV